MPSSQNEAFSRILIDEALESLTVCLLRKT
jgi:hypothetical protein